MGHLNAHRFHHCFPKHPWNVSSWKTSFHPESPAYIPPQPSTCWIWLLKEKKQLSARADTYSASEVIHVRHVHRAREWPPHNVLTATTRSIPRTAIGKNQKTLSHANCSHCLVGNTQWGRFTNKQTNIILFPLSAAIICWNTAEHCVGAQAGNRPVYFFSLSLL